MAALRELDATALILDGEVAVYDIRLVSRFEWLRHSSPPHLSIRPLFMVFDCLQARNKDLRKQPFYVRRNVIEDLLDEQDMVLPVRRLPDDGRKASAATRGWWARTPSLHTCRGARSSGSRSSRPRTGKRSEVSTSPSGSQRESYLRDAFDVPPSVNLHVDHFQGCAQTVGAGLAGLAVAQIDDLAIDHDPIRVDYRERREDHPVGNAFAVC